MSEKVEQKGFFNTIFRSVLLSIIITLFSVLVFAIVVKRAGIGSNVIKSVNQFIKTISVFVGCFFVIRGKLGFLKGGLSGALYSLIIAFLFSVFSKVSVVPVSLLIEIIFTLIVGAISGVVAVNRKL